MADYRDHFLILSTFKFDILHINKLEKKYLHSFYWFYFQDLFLYSAKPFCYTITNSTTRWFVELIKNNFYFYSVYY